MTLAKTISEALGVNALEDALHEAKTYLKANPSDQTARHLYIDLLIVAGDYERADNQCSLAATFAPEATMGFALLRNSLRGMAARDAWFASGAVPEFPEGPSEVDRLSVRLGIAHRMGEREEAGRLLAEREEQRGEQAMVLNGKKVGDFRDLDDRTANALEVIMTGGAYLWVDFGKIASLTIEPIARPRDLAFRSAELQLVSGAVATVLLPAIYPGSVGEGPLLALGRETEWIEEASGITTGRGQRCFLCGNDLMPFQDIASLDAAEARTSGKRVVHG